MSQSQAVKEKSLTILDEENDSHDLSEEISSRLQLDGFTWVENNFSEELLISNENENILESSGEKGKADAENVNVAQHDTNTESGENAEECPLECRADIEHIIITPSDWERGLIVEEHYWEQYGSVVKNESSSKPKYTASQRLTVKDYDKIDHDKRRNRDPSHYKFDYLTTVVLRTLSEQKHAGPYHNVVSRGSNSVLIYAEYPEVPYIRGVSRMSSYYGVAVKVYKLSNDVYRNNAIFKRVHREYINLLHLQKAWYIPTLIHKMENVIVTQFIGEDQETAPSISIVPPVYCRAMYQLIVKEMKKWYKMFYLVHGNLSTQSIVVKYDKYDSTRYIPYFLGWSHSVKTNHPNALAKLLRDCQFITNFFKKKEVTVKPTLKLFKDITGLDKMSSKLQDAINKQKVLWQEKDLTNSNRESQKCCSKNHRTYH